MAGRRMRLKITPAELRKQNRERIMNTPASHRDMVAFVVLHTHLTSPDFYYTTTQLRAMAEGLEQGIGDAEARDAADRAERTVAELTT